jgi:hypothetical protein
VRGTRFGGSVVLFDTLISQLNHKVLHIFIPVVRSIEEAQSPDSDGNIRRCICIGYTPSLRCATYLYHNNTYSPAE